MENHYLGILYKALRKSEGRLDVSREKLDKKIGMPVPILKLGLAASASSSFHVGWALIGGGKELKGAEKNLLLPPPPPDKR